MSSDMPDWVEAFPAAVTITSKEGTILYMNDRAARGFESSGGRALVGKNLDDCHNERSRAIIRAILESEEPNVYTIEKGGLRTLIYQSPWYEEGRVAGLAELSIVIPATLPHFKRD
jgi:PAS domain-containing protein